MSLFPVAILAGGRGTRLGDLTKDKPKCLVDVNGKPFIIRQLELLKSQGIDQVVLCLGYGYDMVMAALGPWMSDPENANFSMAFSVDGDTPLGTAGAIRHALPLLGDEFFVLYGDSYLECNYGDVQEAYKSSGKLALMTVVTAREPKVGNATAYGNSIVGYGEGDLEDYGLSVFSKKAFDWSRHYYSCELGSFFKFLAKDQQLAAFYMPERFHEIGSLEGLGKLKTYLARKSIEPTTHSGRYLDETQWISSRLDIPMIERMVELLVQLRGRKGRLFILGVGGSAANASHAVNDFRKICGIEAYAPTDNVAELTARTNDDGWEEVFLEWLITSHASKNDMILVLSVGGGTMQASYCIAKALCVTAERPQVIGIVGRSDGYTSTVAEECLVVPTISPDRVTPHAESFQMVVLHLMVSHPRLKR